MLSYTFINSHSQVSDPGPNGLLVCHSGYQETETLANSEYPDEMSHNVLTGLAQA